jgi:hypothetical protein
MSAPMPHIDDHDLTQYIRERLDSERCSHVQAHVRDCPTCKERLVAGFIARLGELTEKEPGKSNERRTEGRFLSGDRGYLQTICPLSFERPAVQIVDVSKGGFGLLMNSLLEKGTIVQVCTGTTSALGTVQSCRATENNQFRLGVRVQRADELKLKIN